MLDQVALGALIRAKRGAKKLTQATLAGDVFGDEGRKGDISRIEGGKVTPQEATIQRLMKALDISEAELAPIRQSRQSARQLDDIPALSRDQLQILASRFGHPAPYDTDDPTLREYLRGKADEYRAYRATIDNLDDRVAAVANLKGAAHDAAERLDFDEVEALLSRVDEVETEIAAETKVARARNALLRNDPDHAFTLLSAAADSFASLDPMEPARRRVNYADLLFQHGRRYPGPALARAAQMNRDALAACPKDTDATLWARLQNNLGNALQTLGERQDDPAPLHDAVTAYRAALTVRTREASPMDWAMTQNALGNALATVGARQDDPAPLHDAVAAYRAALTIRTSEASPMDWATTQNNLGAALQTLGARQDDPALLHDAVAAYRAALTIYTPEASPMHWAMTQNNLGAALRDHGTRQDDPALLTEALNAFRAALTVYTREAAPFDYAQTQENLAIALLDRARLPSAPDPQGDLAAALAAVDAALAIYTPDHTPYHHATATRLREDILAAIARLT